MRRFHWNGNGAPWLVRPILKSIAFAGETKDVANFEVKVFQRIILDFFLILDALDELVQKKTKMN